MVRGGIRCQSKAGAWHPWQFRLESLQLTSQTTCGCCVVFKGTPQRRLTNLVGRHSLSIDATPSVERKLKKSGFMTKDEFRQVLERFRFEFNAVEGVDAGVRDRINALITDFEQHVETSDDARHRRTLLERFGEFTERFETDHPSIAGMLDRILGTLGNIGI